MKSEGNAKGTRVQEDKDEGSISPIRGKTRRKSLAVEEHNEAGTSRRKPASPSKHVKELSPLSPPPKSPTTIRTSERSAALKVSQRLHDEIVPDMNTYQQGLKKGRISLGAAQEKY
jgi:mediator of DNA damage checkpoint protein 1